MKVLLHDLQPEEFKTCFPSLPPDIHVVGPSLKASPHYCIGCFGCWTRTPGHCVIRDGYGDLSTLLGKATDLIIISRVVYGGFSPFIKNLLDRNIGYILPFFRVYKNEIHHRLRHKTPPVLTVAGYGPSVSPAELRTMGTVIKANTLNLGILEHHYYYGETPDSIKELKGVLS